MVEPNCIEIVGRRNKVLLRVLASISAILLLIIMAILCWPRLPLGGALINIDSNVGCYIPGYIPLSTEPNSVTYLLQPGVYRVSASQSSAKSSILVVYHVDLQVKMHDEGCQSVISPDILQQLRGVDMPSVRVTSD